MKLQQQQRAAPYPYTWEIPAAIALTVGYALTLGVHLGRALAAQPTCGAWLWPDARAWFTSLPAVLAGDAAAGLSDAECVQAGPGPLIAWIIASELVLLVLLALCGKWLLDHWGPGRLKGMATPDEAAQLLGVARLRRARHIIRPDLYPRKRAQP